MKNIKKKIAIIGAGISGLYLAWKTSKKFDVTIVHTFETKESTIKKNIDNSANKIIYLENNIEKQYFKQ